MAADDYLDDVEELTDADLDEIEAAEIDDIAEAGPTQDYGSNIVAYADREFEIGEPDIGITLRIIRCFGQVGIRAERAVMRALSSLAQGAQSAPTPSGRAVMFGMLATLQEQDLIALGSAVLQFKDDREGRRWIREHGLKLAPIVKALFLNIAQSTDLREAFDNFFVGLGMVDGFLTGIEGIENLA